MAIPILKIVRKIRKIPYGIVWRSKLYWKEYVLRLDIHLKRFFVLRYRAMRERKLLIKARMEKEHLYLESPHPLVSVTIPTWNRGEILCERVLPRIINQTYENIEIIIVGDHCTDNTEELIQNINDNRITFINLAVRGNYPKNRHHMHMVGGAAANTRAQELVKGLWLAHCDDDEEWEPDHIESLLNHAQHHNLELVWGKTRYEISPGTWAVQGSEKFRLFDIPHSTVFMRSYLTLFKPDFNSWKLELGGDRNRLRRMYFSGVRAGFLDKIVTVGPLRPGNTRLWAMAEDRENY